MADKVFILFPAGRFIWGDTHKPDTKDLNGNPLIVKSGPNTGQPTQRYTMGVAIPKGPEAAHGSNGWQATPWGAEIFRAAQPMGQALNRQDFAWKIIDGDSTAYNQGTPPKRWCDIPNYKGCWILKFGSSFAPKIVNENGTVQHEEPGYIVPGYWVQMYGSVEPNNNAQKPGVYLNLGIASLQGRDAVITTGPDAAAVGFGAGVALPAGVTLAPAGGLSLPQAQHQVPALPTMPAAAPQSVQQPLPLAMPPAVAVQPNPGFAALPPAVMPAAPPMPVAAPPAPAVATMTAKAAGFTLAQFLAQGWTEDNLVAQGYMTR